jgi:ABC-type uncharacterized transport system YnjBCD permease subunit
MSLPLILGALWVVAGTITALLPMRAQMIPGLTLIAAAPVLLLWIGYTHGWIWVAVGAFAFVSMFRRPLNYFIRKALRLPLPPLPPELDPNRRQP